MCMCMYMYMYMSVCMYVCMKTSNGMKQFHLVVSSLLISCQPIDYMYLVHLGTNFEKQGMQYSLEPWWTPKSEDWYTIIPDHSPQSGLIGPDS